MTATALLAVRQSIDRLDRRLFGLVDLRAKLAAQAWTLRGPALDDAGAGRDPAREEAIVENVLRARRALSLSGIDDELVVELWRAILEVCASHARITAAIDRRRKETGPVEDPSK